MKRLIALALILPTFLSSTCFAADPRKMLKAQKAYFSSMEEDRAGLRRAQDIQAMENSKLAMLEQKNAVSDLIARNGSSAVSASGGKTTDPAPSEPEPETPHAGYDDVRQLPQIVVPDPDEITGSYGPAILMSPFSIHDPTHPLSKVVHSTASSLFNSAAMGAISKVRYEAEMGPDPSEALAAGKNLIGQAGLSASTIRAIANAAKAGSLQPSYFNPLLREVAILAAYIYLAYAPQTITDYYNERALYSTGYWIMAFPEYVGLAASRALNNDPRISAAMTAATRDKDFAPLLGLFTSYADLAVTGGAASIVRSAVLKGREAVEIYAHARAEYEVTRNLYDFQAQMAHYGAILSEAADIVSSIPGEVRAVGAFRELSRDGGIARVNLLGASAEYRDGQGNSLVIDALGALKLDFSLNRPLSDVVKRFLGPNRYWFKKVKNADGTYSSRLIDDIRADYSVLSKTYPDLSVRKIVERGSDTIWQFVNKHTQQLMMEVTTPGSHALDANQHPLASTDLIRLTEYYDLGRLSLVRIENVTTGDLDYIRKETFSSSIRYDAATGQVADGVITNNLLGLDNNGFAITMRDGYIQEVYLGDASLYGLPASIRDGSALPDVPAKRDLEKMLSDAKKFLHLFLPDEFNAMLNLLKGQAPNVGVRGQISNIDLTTTTTENGVGEKKSRYQSGDFYADEDNGLNGKNNRAQINLSPIAYQDGVLINVLEGQFGRDVKLLQSTLFGIPEIGLFRSLKGSLGSLSGAKGDAKGGAYVRSALDSQDFKTQVFLEKDSNGKEWVGLKFTVVDGGKTFTSGEYKTQLVRLESEAQKSEDATMSYLLGKVALGIYAGRGDLAPSGGQMTRLAGFMVEKVKTLYQEMYNIADQATQKLINKFNSLFPENKLDEIFHVFLHAIPAMTRKVLIADQNTTGLRFLPNGHPMTTIPLKWGIDTAALVSRWFF